VPACGYTPTYTILESGGTNPNFIKTQTTPTAGTYFESIDYTEDNNFANPGAGRDYTFTQTTTLDDVYWNTVENRLAGSFLPGVMSLTVEDDIVWNVNVEDPCLTTVINPVAYYDMYTFVNTTNIVRAEAYQTLYSYTDTAWDTYNNLGFPICYQLDHKCQKSGADVAYCIADPIKRSIKLETEILVNVGVHSLDVWT